MAAKSGTRKCPTSPNPVPSFLRSRQEMSLSTLQKPEKIKVNDSYLPNALVSCRSQGRCSAQRSWTFITATKNLFLGKSQKERCGGADVAWRRSSGSAGNTPVTLGRYMRRLTNSRDWLMQYYRLWVKQIFFSTFQVIHLALMQSQKAKLQTSSRLSLVSP